jgi:hypothetical protein
MQNEVRKIARCARHEWKKKHDKAIGGSLDSLMDPEITNRYGDAHTLNNVAGDVTVVAVAATPLMVRLLPHPWDWSERYRFFSVFVHSPSQPARSCSS